jgi:hypothetical protein
MRKIFFLLFSGIISVMVTKQLSAQGCVAIRSTGGMCMAEHTGSEATTSGWSFNANNRYFKSFRHYVGTEEQKQRIALGTEVINHTNVVDLTLNRNFNDGWSAAVDMPVLSNIRSSLYEHGGKSRHNTNSFGLGDVRFSVYKWLLHPSKNLKGNIQAGLGIKLPTGDYKYQDYFYKSDGSQVLAPVDQSIQLGDGGTGFTGEMNAFYNFSNRVGVYGNFFYLVNPREQNGTSTARGGTPSADALAYGTAVMSVPDQWMARAGGNLTYRRFTASAGMRMECLPAHDLVGGNAGFRRPGYIISAEPGITYGIKKFSVYSFVPVALVRNRTQSYADELKTKATGKHAQGDAAFADYTVNVGVSFKF